MANITNSVAQSAGFIPSFWANKALDVLRSQITLLNLFATDKDFAPGFFGQTLTVPYPGTFTTQQKAPGTPVTPTAPVNGNSVQLTLSNHQVVSFEVEDFSSALATGKLGDRYIEPATVALVEKVETDIWMTALQSATTAPVGTAGTAVNGVTISKAAAALHTAKAPMTNRAVVLSPGNQQSVLTDPNLQSFFAFSQSDDVKNGYFGKLYGFDTYMSQIAPQGYVLAQGSVAYTLSFAGQTTTSIPLNSTAATVQNALAALSTVGAGNVSVSGSTAGTYSIAFTPTIDASGTLTVTGTGAAVTRSQLNIAAHQDAVMYAVRPFAPVPASTGVDIAIATDPESGLSLRLSAQYNISALAVQMNLDILYGMTVLRPGQATVLAS